MFTGHAEIWVICGVIVLLFGAAAIPKLARSIGKAKGEFEKGVEEGKDAVDNEGEEDEAADEAADAKTQDDGETDDKDDKGD